jgi:type IV pilus assembly protein PilM
MLGSHSSTSVVGLDIETGSVAASEVSTNGSSRIGRYAIAPLEAGIAREGEVAEPEALGEVLKDLFARHRLPRNVRVGIASQRVVVRTIRMPRIEKAEEIDAAIRFQAADSIPMPLEHAVLDWQLAEPALGAVEDRQMEVVVVAARREAVSGIAEAIHAAGLKPVGIDVSAFGMIRALAPELTSLNAPSYEQRLEGAMLAEGGGIATGGMPDPARLFCNLGDVTNLAVARGTTCLFTRISAFGVEGIAQQLAERNGLTLEHARQWLPHVGLDAPVETIEGKPEIVKATRDVLTEGAAKLAGELRISLDYFGSQEGAVAVEEIIVCGSGAAIDGLPEALSRELGFAVRAIRPSALSEIPDGDAARLTLSYGLGMES